MVELDLALEGLDRGLRLAFLRHHREHVRDGLAAVRRQHAVVGEFLVNRLDALEPEQAAELAGDPGAGSSATSTSITRALGAASGSGSGRRRSFMGSLIAAGLRAGIRARGRG